MNTIGKSFSERLKTGTDALKQKSEILTAKAGEAIASAQKAVQENMENNNSDPNNFEESAIAPPTDGSSELTTTTTTTSDEKQQQQQQQQQKPNIAANLTEGFKGMMAKFPNDKNHNQEVIVTDLVEVLSSLFDFDPKAKKPHEMVEALELEGIATWRAFLLMAEEDIPTLRKKGDVPIAKNSIRMLTYLKQLVMYNINNDVENARDPALYTREAFDGFVEDLQLGRKDPRAKEPSAAGEEGDVDEDGKPKRNIRQSLTGFASRLKPGARVEDGSLADILTKAKAKVFHKRGSSGNDGSGKPGVGDEVSVDEDAGSVVSDLGTTTTTTAGGNAGGGGVEAAVASGTTLEDMKKNVDDLASKLKKTSTDTAGKTKEEVQKMMVPLLSNLKKSQDKFAALVEARKKKNAEKKAARIAAGEEDVDDDEEGAGATGDDDDDDKFKHLFDDDDTGKLRNLLSHAEKATMKAFHDAETVARQAARKAGILEGKEEEEEEGGNDAVASPAASGEEEPASVRV